MGNAIAQPVKRMHSAWEKLLWVGHVLRAAVLLLEHTHWCSTNLQRKAFYNARHLPSVLQN